MKDTSSNKWKLMELSEIGKIITGNTPSKSNPENYGDDIVWVKPPDLDKKKYVDTSSEKISKTAKNLIRLIPKNSVLVSCIGNIGKVAISNCELCTNQQINSIIPNNDLIDSKFLFYTIKKMRPFLDKQGSSAVIPLLNKSEFSKIKISVPPLPVQQKIVSILEKTDKLKEIREDADELTTDYLQAVFLELFGDPLKNPKKWEIMKFSEIGVLSRGKSKHRPRNDPVLLGGKYPLIQTGDVANSKGYITKFTQTYSEFGLKQSKMWVTGTLCITIAANIAKTGILTFDACFPDSVVGFTSNEYTNTEYIQHWLSFLQKTLENNAPESAQKNINLTILENLNVPIPPIALQNEFSNIVKSVNEMSQHQEHSKKNIENISNTFMQKAFKGELVC